MDNILNTDVIALYIQLRCVPNNMIYDIFPELDDPSNDKQYQFLKLEYQVLEACRCITDALESLYQLLQGPLQCIADNFSLVGKELDNISKQFICVDDEIFEFKHVSSYMRPLISHLVPVYQYTKDIRKETRMYLRNHIY